jgi:hypothetical protein
MKAELSRLDAHSDEDMGTALRSMRKENGVQLRARELLRSSTLREHRKMVSVHGISFMHHRVGEEECGRTSFAIYRFGLMLESLMSEPRRAR